MAMRIRRYDAEHIAQYGRSSYEPIRINSLTTKVHSGRNEKLLIERILASYTQAHKHPHHDGAVFLSCGMVLMDKNTAPLGASLEGVG